MLVGLIGKPNAGKSTFFNAATMLSAKVANYPFTTIEPNVGIAWVATNCVCRELGIKDNPVNSRCEDGIRYIPVKLVDLPGLIPGAHKGEGLGNQFLDSVMRADALIHVIDASGYTDEEGRALENPSHDPLQDVEFIENEVDLWIAGIIMKDMQKINRSVKMDEVIGIIAPRLSGLGVDSVTIKAILLDDPVISKLKYSEWDDKTVLEFSKKVRVRSKPILIAANKADIQSSDENIKKLIQSGRTVIPVSAEAELLLRKAAKSGLLKYRPGEDKFEIVGNLTEAQKGALEFVNRILKKYGSTGIQQVINYVYFTLLDMIVVYPVEDENKFSDKKGNVLPDAHLIKRGSTTRDLAFIIHTDLGEGFLYAVDARTKMKLSAEHQLKNNDIIKIASAAKRG
ncbi:MAG: redox-regulated ATPase YchF [Nitrososphaerota archaeon]|jgi:ribosome-binding ATPase YchF (GTP1/OBG family)|nr:redox-regulated ATPase YchF [Nitrososphaerota archaeon]MDG6927556.1 redox-regulated ATPase YchF [Nitrososphaerota archaeon]MDG6930671.1 redox-regulated ATPase YchF [Nitrososphaerota archaeon]MDG6932506.1 redox-regulated ATPase YchF [Nitrososphaerota archaeon]MDG6936213.1 redox-regulated ATPase YchF [Nitrososphaerota archaeon]